MAECGKFQVIEQERALESEDGMGLLWYTNRMAECGKFQALARLWDINLLDLAPVHIFYRILRASPKFVRFLGIFRMSRILIIS
jgi:hypothetical protein